jgi:hypothetical protein
MFRKREYEVQTNPVFPYPDSDKTGEYDLDAFKAFEVYKQKQAFNAVYYVMIIIMLALILVSTGCNEEKELNLPVSEGDELPVTESNEIVVPEDVMDFVNSYEFDRLNPISVILDIASENITVFEVKYGEAGILMGAALSPDWELEPDRVIPYRGVGLKSGDKIAWLFLEEVDKGIKSYSDYPLYDFDDRDDYVYSREFLVELEKADDILFNSYFIPLIKADPDTPEETRQFIKELSWSID